MIPRKSKTDASDPDAEPTDEEEEYERARCDRIPGAKDYWAKVEKIPIRGTIPPGWKL